MSELVQTNAGMQGVPHSRLCSGSETTPLSELCKQCNPMGVRGALPVACAAGHAALVNNDLSSVIAQRGWRLVRWVFATV